MTNESRGGEFEIIAEFFAPLTDGVPLAFGLRNDAALLDVPAGRSLVVTVDAMVEGVHFLPDDPADLVAQKLLRCNLSDLAAMGAEACGYVMTTAMPSSVGRPWLAAFAQGLRRDQTHFRLNLLGGDVVKTPGPLTLSLTALGHVPAGRTLLRNGARPGDVIFLSGTVGDAALGLKVLKGELRGLSPEAEASLAERYRLPRPRLELGQGLLERDLATAALDVSDGLLADLGHIADGSGLGAEVAIHALPLSAAVGAALAADRAEEETILTGGDDYELLFTASPDKAGEVTALSRALDLPLTRIGHMTEEAGLKVLDASGIARELGAGGWRHF